MRHSLVVALAVASVATCGGRPAVLPVVQANDNRTPSGTMRGDTLEMQLEVRMARWYPEAIPGPYVDAPAFAEGGKAPQIPGPLIRVPRGTVLALTLRNSLSDSTLTLHGFATRPAADGDSITLAPGAERTLRFAAGEPGTYFYRATAGHVDWDVHEREQLAGAFVVDSARGAAQDRVFVINIWGDPIDSTSYRNAVAINGRSWPHTERISVVVGDSVRWRWINASVRPHPMHLHGFYYRIDAHGDALRDTAYTDSARRLVVTEVMQAAQTMSMKWSPDRDGQWLFHCHIGFHVIPDTRLDPPGASDRHDALSEDAGAHMAGLVLGVAVAAPHEWRAAPRGKARSLTLHVQEGARRGRAPRAMGYVLQRGDRPPMPDSLERSSPVLVMHRAEPVDITVVNHLAEATAVHWHGIELESYSDGVAGWSGTAQRLAPLIATGDSFVARLTLKRAGTFMYHTHLGDFVQLTSGLFGGIVVLEPGERFDPARDHVFLAGWDGPEDPPHLTVNGDTIATAITFAPSAAHRLRFINIGVAVPIMVRLTRDSALVPWRAIAKDGADLPRAQRVARPATLTLDVGETADFEFRPPSPGSYVLTIRVPGKAPPYELRIRVP
ncbi:MAG: multicopper oxidase domain-containing protein [Gemmatimonadaceae bacterium]